tara:strand:- start:377 stop:1732 length:1356 start_codon:yes stop_codon:yes gene_type:complete
MGSPSAKRRRTVAVENLGATAKPFGKFTGDRDKTPELAAELLEGREVVPVAEHLGQTRRTPKTGLVRIFRPIDAGLLSDVTLNEDKLDQYLRIPKHTRTSNPDEVKLHAGQLFSVASKWRLEEQPVYVIDPLDADQVGSLTPGSNGVVYELTYKFDDLKEHKYVLKIQADLSQEKYEKIRESIRVASDMRKCAIVPAVIYYRDERDGFDSAAVVTLMLKLTPALEVRKLNFPTDGAAGSTAETTRLKERIEKFGKFVYDVLVCFGEHGASFVDFKLENIGYNEKSSDFLLFDIDSVNAWSFTLGRVPWRRHSSARYIEAGENIDIDRNFGLPERLSFVFSNSERMCQWYTTVHAAMVAVVQFVSPDNEWRPFRESAKTTPPSAETFIWYINRAVTDFELGPESKFAKLATDFCIPLGNYREEIQVQTGQGAATVVLRGLFGTAGPAGAFAG